MSRVRLPGGRAALALLAVAAVAAAAFSDLLLGGRVLFEGDIHGHLWGQCAAFANVVRGGAWPLWDPYLGLGHPLLANPGTQVLYPPTWLNLLLQPEDFVDLYAIGHLVLAGLGMLWLARTLRLSWGASTTAAAVWMLSGPLLSAVDLWQHFAGAAWLPWVVAGAARALARPTRGRVLGWALLQTAQALTGSLDLVVLTALPQAGLLLTGLSWRRPLDRRNARLVAAAAVAAVLTVAWTAALWVPAKELLSRTARAEQPAEERTKWSAPPVELAQTLLPLFPQSLPLRKDARRLVWGADGPLLESLYLGLPALALALAAAGSPRRRLAAGAGGLVAVSLLLSLGRWGLLYFWVIEAAPPLEILRFPVKATLLAGFGFAVLVALGLETWRTDALSSRATLALAAVVGGLGVTALLVARWAGTAGAGLLAPSEDRLLFPGTLEAVAALATWSGAAAVVGAGLAALAASASSPHRGRLVAGLALLAVLDLLVVHRGLNPTIERDFVARTPEVVRLLHADGARRVYAFDYLLSPAGGESLRPPVPVAQRRVPGPLRHLVDSQAFRLSTPRWALRGSYDYDLVGLDSRTRRGLRLLAIAVERDPAQLLRLLQVGGVTHVVALHRQGLELLEPVATFRHPTVGDVHVYRVPGTLLPVAAVAGWQVARGLPAYQALLDPSLDPQTTVVLPEGAPCPPPAGFRGEVEVLEERADRLRVRTVTNAPGLLLVSDGFDDGWRAVVDAERVPLLRANLAFRAVPLPAGTHEVEVAYRPPSAVWGLDLTALSIAATLVFVAVRRRRGDGPPDTGGAAFPQEAG